RLTLAESRLRSAIDLAVAAGSVLNEAEASRELALLYQAMGRNQDALRLLNVAYRLFRRLDARVDLVHVGGKVAELEGTYLAVVQMHPVWGIELLANVDFPWDLKPIIRWHHERYDGSGYPDRLKGDEIPLSAQIVGLLDVYDALTNPRAYAPALSVAQALEAMADCRGWWCERVFRAFWCVVAQQTSEERRPLE